MTPPANQSEKLKFSDFVVDPRSGELFRRGKKVKLQNQPMQVLLALVEHPGQIVTREELRQKIWPSDTFVDFEHSLNTAIKKLRSALGDNPSNAKFVETLPRRGYRFLVEVQGLSDKPVRKPATGSVEGQVFALSTEEDTHCVLAPVDHQSMEEWQRLLGLNDDVGVSIMITERKLLLLEAGTDVRVLSEDGADWCEVRVLDGEHYGRTALVNRKSLQAMRSANTKK
jgi:DNA-binding winged helix-turn-helix (wHTH) protein